MITQEMKHTPELYPPKENILSALNRMQRIMSGELPRFAPGRKSPKQCEYQFLTDRESGIAMGRPVGRTLPTGLFEPIPNYHGDLNAMHEAEKVLTWKQQVVYRTMLQKLCVTLTDAHMATAARRAEAFLRVHNLWRE